MVGRQWVAIVPFLVVFFFAYSIVLAFYGTSRKLASSFDKPRQWPYVLINFGSFLLTLVICTMCAGIVGFLILLAVYVFLAWITCSVCVEATK